MRISNIKRLESISNVSQYILSKIGIDSEDELNKLILKKIRLKFLHPLRLKMKKDISNQIDKKYNFFIPNKLINMEIDRISSIDKKSNIIKNTYNVVDIKKRIKMGLIITKIIQLHKIDVTEDELKKFIDLEYNYGNKKHYNASSISNEQIKSQFLEEKAFDFIFKNIKYNNIDINSKNFIENIIPQIKN